MYLRGLSQAGSDLPVMLNIPIEQYEALRAEAEKIYIDWQTARAAQVGIAQAAYEAAEKFGPSGSKLLPSPSGTYIKDPNTGKWWRAGNITQPAWEILTPGTAYFVGSVEEWIARVEASREALYGSVLTLPARLGWDQPWTLEEVNLWATALGWPNEIVEKFFDSFPTREDAVEWIAQATANPAMWDAKAKELFPPPPKVVIPAITPPPAAPPPPPPPPAAAPPPAAGGGETSTTGYGYGNIAAVGSTPPGHRYKIIQYAPHPGTPMLQQSGWQSDEIGFWLTQAFGGDLELTEAFLLSFAGREALAAWLVGKVPADVYARADAALATRKKAKAAGAPPPPPGTAPPPAGAEAGISLPLLALLGAGAIYLWKR